MQKLSFYEGSSELSFCFNGDLFRYPYTYSSNLFSNSFSKDQFYEDVFGLASRVLNFDMTKVELTTCGVLKSPKVAYEAHQSGSVLTKLSENQIYVNHDLIGLESNINSYVPVNFFENESDFSANLHIYLSLVLTETHDITEQDTLLRAILSLATISIKSGDVLLTGEYFTTLSLHKALSYLFILDLLNPPGLFRVKIDSENAYPHAHMGTLEDISYTKMGTLINSPGKTECLYKTDLGTSQLIDLKPEKLFILPLDEQSEGTIFVKTSQTQFEEKVHGGELGVVIDTRDKSNLAKQTKIGVDVILQALNRV